MRFVLAIVAFVVAAVMIVAGIAQRTVFAPPTQLTASVTVPDDARYVVIAGSALNAHSGQQTLSVSGAPDVKSQVVAIGRTEDVTAWLGTEKYVAVGYDSAADKLTTRTVTPKASTGSTDATDTPTPTPTPTATAPAGGATEKTVAGPNPTGSDLWLEEYDGANAQVTRMSIPDGVSVLVASDGTKPAPSKILVTWPVDSSTPWAFPLIIGGLVLLVIGIALYLWGLYTHRKSRGPRRKSGPKMPKLPKAPKYKPSADVEVTSRGRRSTRRSRMIAPAVLVGALTLSGVGTGAAFADETPTPTPTPTSTPTSTSTAVPKPVNQLPPAVTVPQLERIIKRISVSAANADAKADPNLAKERFTGAALQLREANYAIRAKKADQAALPAIPSDPIVLSLPQSTDSWPRTVVAVIDMPKDAEGKDQAPQAITLVQDTPRDNYMVEYAVSLEPKAKVPNLAPASIGAAAVRPDSKLLALPPNQVAAAYGDVLMNGDDSKYASLFDSDGDTLRTAVGLPYKNERKSSLASTASLTFTNQVPANDTVAMATNDSGAIVWTDLLEFETIKVTEAGAEITLQPAGGATAALLGAPGSKTGVESTYSYQLAFYVPPAGSDAKITLLGFAQGLVAVKEVQ
ncbi:hypothetical protein [Leifsonia sp. 71-9]|uniref:hypothetical protein n=1 Tax=Leifsonia sp. 71-9 TaxID=1895934 RepID=UPI000929AB10|nr:hypothetical protein [Leifsonia sp. 71-9]OJX81531.1 MAG: hypothetical protein BGO91_04100 [Leifsonia sp. 71-9]